jgi:hypothetical protein
MARCGTARSTRTWRASGLKSFCGGCAEIQPRNRYRREKPPLPRPRRPGFSGPVRPVGNLLPAPDAPDGWRRAIPANPGRHLLFRTDPMRFQEAPLRCPPRKLGAVFRLPAPQGGGGGMGADIASSRRVNQEETRLSSFRATSDKFPFRKMRGWSRENSGCVRKACRTQSIVRLSTSRPSR